jgi:hypothetical protein
MQTGGVAVAILILTAACGSASATASAQCGPSGAHTLAADSRARVYASGGGVYGCANSSGHSYLLAPNESRLGQRRVGKVALAGVDAAYSETTYGVDTGSATVTVRRLDTGRTLRSLAAMTQPVGPEAFESVDSLVVKANGSVAWIVVASSIVRHSSQTEVNRADRRGEARLDTGPGIGSSSLRLRGSELSWSAGGATRTATLF